MKSSRVVQERDTSADDAQAQKMRQYVRDNFPKALHFLISSNEGNLLLLREPDGPEALRDGYSKIGSIDLRSLDAQKEIDEWVKYATRHSYEAWFDAGRDDKKVAQNLLNSRHSEKRKRGLLLMDRVNRAESQDRREKND